MPIVNRDYLKLVLLYVYVNSMELSTVEILTTFYLVSKSHRAKE